MSAAVLLLTSLLIFVNLGNGCWNYIFPSSIECPELDWGPLQPMKNIRPNTKCWEDNKPSFKVYTRSQQIDLEVDETLEIKSTEIANLEIAKLVVIFHGYTESSQSWYYIDMKNNILFNDGTPNLAVLMVDWKEGASVSIPIYTQAAANSRYAGLATMKVISQLQTKMMITNLACVGARCGFNIHCIGHSLGAHACGFFGNSVKTKLGRSILRITGLDPAGPQFYTKEFAFFPRPLYDTPLYEKLDKSDAALVDVIHTDSDKYGFAEYAGHADFYIGKNLEELGQSQDGCIDNFYDYCSHQRSVDQMNDSIRNTSNCFGELSCNGEDLEGSKGCLSPVEAKPKVQYGYWWDGTDGQFGVVITGDSRKCSSGS